MRVKEVKEFFDRERFEFSIPRVPAENRFFDRRGEDCVIRKVGASREKRKVFGTKVLDLVNRPHNIASRGSVHLIGVLNE